jgi:aminoglycoside/choline kinase family phosphotransferase
VRPWSTILKVPTTEGDVYFKATAGQLANETELTLFLAAHTRELVPDILASDVGRGWLLMRDGGTRLRDVISVDRDLRHWETLLPTYAELQIDMADHRQYLLSIGTPDHGLKKLPGNYEDLLANDDFLMIDCSDGLSRQQVKSLRELVPLVSRMADELAGHAVPESLDHGDFHDGNVLVQDGRYILFDWGDSTVTHPFFSLRTVFVSLENTLNLVDEAIQARLLDAYLEPWATYEPHQDLLKAFALARTLSIIDRAVVWRYYLTEMDHESRHQYEYAVPSLLKEFLDCSGTTP